jgi:hypothetical protein
MPSSALSSKGSSLNVTYSGLVTGTVLYGLAVNSNHEIIATTPNSEAGFLELDNRSS